MRRNLLAVFVLFIGRKTGGNTKVRRGSMISLFLPYIPAQPASYRHPFVLVEGCGGEIAVCIE